MTGILVNEWLTKTGGAENVIEEMGRVFADAPIVCLWDDAHERFAPGRVHETWLARTPLRRAKALALLVMPATWNRLKNPLEEPPGWTLSCSHLFAHHARFRGVDEKVPRLAYVHTPARYIWSPELDGRGDSLIARTLSLLLKPVDRRRAGRLTSIAVNSLAVAERVRTCWGRDSTVIYPPVDVEYYSGVVSANGSGSGVVDTSALTPSDLLTLSHLPSQFVLGASRFVAYKRLDLVIDFGLTADVDVVLAGSGPERARLEKIALRHEARVHFIDAPSRLLLRELYRRAAAYIFPAWEDFGIMPVEAMAAGTPVVALNRGGASETVVDGTTGVLLQDFTRAEMLRAWAAIPSLTSHECLLRAQEFSAETFRARLAGWVANEVSPS